ncbi:hypothetical protein ACM75L_30815 [Pseudomonas aeruginosa]
MNSITIVLRSGMGMQIDSVRPYLRNGMPIAIGRAGAVISHFADGDAHLALRTIAEYPCPEQDNMPAANMRQIALAALSGAGVSTEPGNPGGEPVSGPGNAGERPHPAPGSGDSELAESLQTLERWLDRVAIEDGYVGVPVIEAVEVVVTEMKRQQQPVDPAFCRCNHWFAGDSVEAAFIRQHGQCQDCVEMDQMLEREVQAENAKRYLWLRNTALYASDLARQARKDKHTHTVRGRTGTIEELVETLPSPVSASTVRRRLAGGMPLEEALLTPAIPPFSNSKRENPDDQE